jgi:hypothetical protein
VSIEDFGVVDDPNGQYVQQNYAAYMAAIARVNGQARLRHRAGLTVVVPQMASTNPIYLELDGLLKLAPNVNQGVLGLTGSGNVITGNGAIDGNKSNQTGIGTGGYGISATGSGISNSLIRGITIQNCYDWPFNIANSNSVTVELCNLLNSGNSPEFVNSNNCHLLNNFISGINDEGFAFYGGVTNSSAIGNTITNCDSGINVFSDTVSSAPSSNLIIRGNVLYGNTLSGISVATNGVNVVHTEIDISDNTSYGNNTGLNTGGSEIYMSSVNNFTLANNRCNGTKGASSAGINFLSTANYGILDGNRIYNIGSTGSTNVGIQFSGNLGIVYLGGIIFDNRSTPLMAYGADGSLGANCALLNFSGFGTIGTLNNVTISDGPGGNSSFIQAQSNLITLGGYVNVAQSLSVAGAITAQGPLLLDNAFVSGAPTPSGYITIQDKTGTTYYVPVSATA